MATRLWPFQLVEFLLPFSNCNMTVEQLLEEGAVRHANEQKQKDAAQAEKRAKEEAEEEMAQDGGTARDQADKDRAIELKV